MRYRMDVRLTAADVGSRVVIRWRRPIAAGGTGETGGTRDEVADVLGVLQAADDSGFVVRKASGELVTIPRKRALAGKTVPAQPRRVRPAQPGEGMPQAPSQR